MLGRILSNAEYDFDMPAIKAALTERPDQDYAKAKDVYDLVTYEDVAYTLTIDEHGTYRLIYTVDVDCRNHVGEYTERQSERLQFVIEL